METLNLDKALEETAQEENETPAVETPAVETPAESQPGEETPKGDQEKPAEEEKDEFEGLNEITDLNKQFVTLGDGRRVKMQDLIDGNMRQEDYTQKTMELSESRRQIELAQSTTQVDTTKEEKAAIDLTEQNKAIETALGEMDETDPMAIVMKGIFNQNNKVIDFINTQAKANQQAVVDSDTEDNTKHVQKLISDSLDKEAKNYNLPIIKGAEGEEDTNMRDLFNQLVLADLQATNENLTLAQFNHRVSQIGKKAYKRLRTIISAASAGKVEVKPGDEEEGSPKNEKKPSKPSGEAAKPDEDKNKGLGLNERINNALDTLEKNRGKT